MKPKRTWVGALSAVLAGSLLALAAMAPRAVGRSSAPPGAMAFRACQILLQQGGGSSTFAIGPQAGVIQPIASLGNVAACSVTVVPGYTNGSVRLQIVQWDPVALAPDPTTIALRTRNFEISKIMFGETRADFHPPVVTQSLAHVADPPRPSIAIDWRSSPFGRHSVTHASDGDPAIPAALQYPAPGTAPAPLPGSHPVLSHAVCGGDEAVQNLRVIQSVMTTNTVSDTSCFDIVQRFRVPARARLHWVEVAFGVPPRPIYYDPVIAILDARGAAEPPVVLPPSLVEAPFAYFVNTPFWGTHYDFDRLITLEPGRDYWLLVRVEKQYVLYSRTLTGGESDDFTAGIGPSFTRTTPGGAWAAQPDRALCFRLIGEPVAGARALPRGRHREQRFGETPAMPSPSEAGRAAVAPAGASATGDGLAPAMLRLRVAPNPAQGAAFVSWSGASGTLRVDVHDAQGRRVAGVAGAAGTDGRWLWRGAREDGRPLPAGVYFVRAADAAGRVASDRVVLIR